MLDYTAMDRELPGLKARLTRAINSKDPDKVLAAVKVAFARFDVIGYPDQWHRWERAKDDATFAKQHGRKLPLK